MGHLQYRQTLIYYIQNRNLTYSHNLTGTLYHVPKNNLVVLNGVFYPTLKNIHKKNHKKKSRSKKILIGSGTNEFGHDPEFGMLDW
jgi:hypothetical protein